MQLSQHTEQLAIAVSNKTFITGAATTGASVAVERSGVAAMLSTTGPEFVNMCAAIGAAATVIGVLSGIFFQALKHRRESRESNWRMGIDPDRRGSPNE